jgi:hypothetical protein
VAKEFMFELEMLMQKKARDVEILLDSSPK